LDNKFSLLWLYEKSDIGCSKDFFEAHCIVLYGDIAVYVVDFIFTSLLIYGSNRVEQIFDIFPLGFPWNFINSNLPSLPSISARQLRATPVFAWLILSGYHLVDFLLFFTPIFGDFSYFWYLSPAKWAEIGEILTLTKEKSEKEEEKCENSIISSTAFSCLGFAYVIYFYRKLLEYEHSLVESERLTTTGDVNALKMSGVDLEAY
jgi:hypothetical protein